MRRWRTVFLEFSDWKCEVTLEVSRCLTVLRSLETLCEICSVKYEHALMQTHTNYPAVLVLTVCCGQKMAFKSKLWSNKHPQDLLSLFKYAQMFPTDKTQSRVFTLCRLLFAAPHFIPSYRTDNENCHTSWCVIFSLWSLCGVFFGRISESSFIFCFIDCALRDSPKADYIQKFCLTLAEVILHSDSTIHHGCYHCGTNLL